MTGAGSGSRGMTPGARRPGATAPRGATADRPIAVSALTQAARDVVEGGIPAVWVAGEVSGFSPHANGHWYFTLKDERAAVDCVVWASEKPRFPAAPEDGMRVAAYGKLTIWPKRARVQFTVRAMEAEGEGLWRKAFEKTRAALDKDGLLDPARRRPLPRFPRVVGVVTSPSGAALQDIVATIARRNPAIDVVVIPAVVQGETAPQSLVRALRRAARWGGADVLIIGRGGGSREDLWAFNDEQVARAIAACPMPVVSAVGHEVDYSIADLVADLRAPTPTAAAELVVPVLTDLRADLRALRAALAGSARRALRSARSDLGRVAAAIPGRAERIVQRRGERTRRAETALRAGVIRAVERGTERLRAVSGRVHALSPLATLARGYGLPRHPDGRAVAGAAQLAPGDRFSLLLRDGEIDARAEKVRATGSA